MDTFTQAALGAAIGEAGFRRRLGGRAVVWGALCGAAPDLDILINLVDPWASMMLHRSFSHSLLVLPFAAVLFGWLGWSFGRRQGSWLDWSHLSFWGLVTHPLLDTCTSYGTQLLWPLSDERFATDAVAVIDPLYTIPLLVVVHAASRRGFDRDKSRRLAGMVLVLTTLYLGVGHLFAARARTMARARLLEAGVDVVELRATNTVLNNVLYRVMARDAEGDTHVGYVSVLFDRPIDFRVAPRASGALVDAAVESERGREFQWFAMGWSQPMRDDDGALVLADQRYGAFVDPTRSLFRAAILPAADGEGARIIREPRIRIGYGEELERFWQLLTGR